MRLVAPSRRRGPRFAAAAAAPPAARALEVVALGAGVLAGGACSLDTGPEGVPHLQRESFIAGPDYVAWWSEIQACSGLAGAFDRLSFFVVVEPLFVQGRQFPCGPNGVMCNGMWEPPHDITLAPAHLDTERLVKHEMLHDLLEAAGHPPVFEQCEVEWASGADPAR